MPGSSPVPPMSLIWAITIMRGGPNSMPRNAASSPGSKPHPVGRGRRTAGAGGWPDPLGSHRSPASTPGRRAQQSLPRPDARGSRAARHRQGHPHLSNDLDATAQEIADLYKRRWAIELFFRWVKQTLKIRRFLGTSENAVRIQIAVALIAFLLLRLAQATQHTIQSPLALARLILQPDAPQTP